MIHHKEIATELVKELINNNQTTQGMIDLITKALDDAYSAGYNETFVWSDKDISDWLAQEDARLYTPPKDDDLV